MVEIDRELVIKGLNQCTREKLLQGKIIESINVRNYTLAEFLIKLYDGVCEETDEICKKIILACKEETLDDLNEMFGEICVEELGQNAGEDSSLSFILHNVMTDCALSEFKGIIDTDVFEEEIYFYAHSLIVDRYLKSKDGVYKDEFLDYLNNNISRSKSLRALFRGNIKRFNDFNPDLYFDPLQQRIYGEDTMQVTLLEACIMLEEIYTNGREECEKVGITGERLDEIIRAQMDLEKIYLASYYIQSKNHGYDINLDYSQFSDKTISEIREGFEIGEKSYKSFAKVRK